MKKANISFEDLIQKKPNDIREFETNDYYNALIVYLTDGSKNVYEFDSKEELKNKKKILINTIKKGMISIPELLNHPGDILKVESSAGDKVILVTLKNGKKYWWNFSNVKEMKRNESLIQTARRGDLILKHGKKYLREDYFPY